MPLLGKGRQADCGAFCTAMPSVKKLRLYQIPRSSRAGNRFHWPVTSESPSSSNAGLIMTELKHADVSMTPLRCELRYYSRRPTTDDSQVFLPSESVINRDGSTYIAIQDLSWKLDQILKLSDLNSDLPVFWQKFCEFAHNVRSVPPYPWYPIAYLDSRSVKWLQLGLPEPMRFKFASEVLFEFCEKFVRELWMLLDEEGYESCSTKPGFDAGATCRLFPNFSKEKAIDVRSCVWAWKQGESLVDFSSVSNGLRIEEFFFHEHPDRENETSSVSGGSIKGSNEVLRANQKSGQKKPSSDSQETDQTDSKNAESQLAAEVKINNRPAGRGETRHKRGDAQALLGAAFTKHHNFETDQSIGHFEPIGVRKLATMADVAAGSATTFFKKWFKSHDEYMLGIRTGKTALLFALQQINGIPINAQNYGTDPDRFDSFG